MAEKVNALDLLKNLGGKKKATVKKSTDRAELELSVEAESRLKEWVPAKIVADHFESHLKTTQDFLDEELVEIYYDMMWEKKSQPQNPTLKVKDEQGRADMEAMLIVQERFKVSLPPQNDDDTIETVTERLCETISQTVDISIDNVRKMISNEVVITDEKSIPITALMQGRKVGKEWRQSTVVEKSAAEKLIMAICAGQSLELTDEEQEALFITTEYKIIVKDGFMNRVCGYCENKDQFKKLMKFIFKPVISHRGAKFGISDSMEDRNTRLIGVAASVLGIALGIDD